MADFKMLSNPLEQILILIWHLLSFEFLEKHLRIFYADSLKSFVCIVFEFDFKSIFYSCVSVYESMISLN